MAIGTMLKGQLAQNLIRALGINLNHWCPVEWAITASAVSVHCRYGDYRSSLKAIRSERMVQSPTNSASIPFLSLTILSRPRLNWLLKVLLKPLIEKRFLECTPVKFLSLDVEMAEGGHSQAFS